jgi:hypothetical protein
VLASLTGGFVAAVLWLGVLTVVGGSVSNVWPIALVVWTLLELPVAFVVGIPFLIFRNDPTPHGRCRKCGYNLTGNMSGICPECGTRV